jgi:hypothetical protein
LLLHLWCHQARRTDWFMRRHEFGGDVYADSRFFLSSRLVWIGCEEGCVKQYQAPYCTCIGGSGTGMFLMAPGVFGGANLQWCKLSSGLLPSFESFLSFPQHPIYIFFAWGVSIFFARLCSADSSICLHTQY